MPGERLSMRKAREVLRLRHACGASVRTIARSVGVGYTTVAEYLRRTSVIGIAWPVPAEVDIVAKPFGQRPHRVFVDPASDGAAVTFTVMDRVRSESLHRVGQADLLHPSKTRARWSFGAEGAWHVDGT